jgi:hypothetical protein
VPLHHVPVAGRRSDNGSERLAVIMIPSEVLPFNPSGRCSVLGRADAALYLHGCARRSGTGRLPMLQVTKG